MPLAAKCAKVLSLGRARTTRRRLDEGDHDYDYNDEGEETLTGPSHSRPRINVLNDEKDNEDALNTRVLD